MVTFATPPGSARPAVAHARPDARRAHLRLGRLEVRMQPVAWALRPQQLHPAVDRLDRHVERVQEVGPAERVAVHLAVLKACNVTKRA
eukprot:276078-Chlamydomonas_euryale.AAC.6